jgi:hypothetical protein
MILAKAEVVEIERQILLADVLFLAADERLANSAILMSCLNPSS